MRVRRPQLREQPGPPQPVAHGISRKAEELARATQVAVGFPERVEQELSLDGAELVSERRVLHGPRFRTYGGQAETAASDDRIVREEDRSLRDVGKLPNVAWPVMSQQRGPGIGAERALRQAVFTTRAGQEVLG